MPKIYSRTGDLGKTSLVGGIRVLKSSATIAALGDLDELSALLGLTCGLLPRADAEKIVQIQKDLFIAGAILAGFAPAKTYATTFTIRVSWLEQEIDLMTTKLPRLQKFILPNGSEPAGRIHLARAVCRRCERSLVAAGKHRQLLPYLNRLSDYLFTLARFENHRKKLRDVVLSLNPQ